MKKIGNLGDFAAVHFKRSIWTISNYLQKNKSRRNNYRRLTTEVRCQLKCFTENTRKEINQFLQPTKNSVCNKFVNEI